MNKKINLFTGAILCLLTSCHNKNVVEEMPAIVKESFTKHFPGSNAKWEKEDDKYEAAFRWDSHNMSATFEQNGTLIESETAIPVAELPGAIKNYITAHYNGMTIKDAAKIQLADGSIQYEAAIKNRDIIFDVNGNFIKEIKD